MLRLFILGGIGLTKPKSNLIRFVNYLIDYLPIIATVTAATLASLSAVRSNTTTSELLQWILLVLALLATTQLVDRLRLMRGIESKVDQIIQSAEVSRSAESFIASSQPQRTERLKNAKSIAINGMTLARTSNSFYALFKECVISGGQVRLLIIDPDHPALEVAANRFNKHQDPKKLRREVEHTLDTLESLTTDLRIGQDFQLKLAPFVPPYGIWLIDADSPKAEIWVELYSFQADLEPTIQLLPQRDGIWFHFFRQQFENMWQASKPWKIN
jgi:hypothetical protein